jgi:hypothetical protein
MVTRTDAVIRGQKLKPMADGGWRMADGGNYSLRDNMSAFCCPLPAVRFLQRLPRQILTPGDGFGDRSNLLPAPGQTI